MSKKNGNNGGFSYDKYQARKLKEQVRVRRANVNNQFMVEWKKICMSNYSIRRHKIALFFYPPKWYVKVVSFSLKMFQSAMRTFVYSVIIAYSAITVTWMIWIHDTIFNWGISKKIFESRPGFLKMVVAVRGKVVKEMEMQI